MTYKLRGFWLLTAATAISLAMITTVVIPKSTHATDDGNTTENHSRMSAAEHKDNETQSKMRASMAEARTESQTRLEQATQERKEFAREKLSATKLEVCEKRQTNINNRTTRIAERGEKHLVLFTRIAERVKSFYTTKGNTLENYDALVAEVDAKKAAAETAVQSIANSRTGFNCSDGNPKQSVEGFKAQLSLRQAALKEYQVAIKNLIVGVKSVNSTSIATSKENE